MAEKLPKHGREIIDFYSKKILFNFSGNRSKNHLNEDLRTWLSTNSGSKIVDLSVECLSRLDENSTELCISHLLDSSVKFGSKFDWVVAHIGSCFPEGSIHKPRGQFKRVQK